MSLQEKTVVVVGVEHSVGHAIALAFSKRNYNVVVTGSDYTVVENIANEIIGLGGEALAVKCDVTKKEEVDDMMIKATSRYKKINIVVNDAEVVESKPFLDITVTDWENLMNVNLRGALLISQAATREMKDGGKIIFISSIAGSIAWNEMAHYSASKGGLESMMRSMAFELAHKKITVNAVVEGVLDVPEISAENKNLATEKMISTDPERRIGKAEDIAGTVLFIASDAANYITGQTIVVDGGYTLR